MSNAQRAIRSLRVSRAVFLAAAVLLVLIASNLAAYSPGSAFAMALPVAILLTFAVAQTSTIRRWRAEERELSRPRMTPEDYRRLREMEAELGWELSEMPASAPAPAPPARKSALPAACECTLCGRRYEARREGTCGPCRRQETRVLTANAQVSAPGTAALSGTGSLSARVTPGGRDYLPGGVVIRYCAAPGKRVVLEDEGAGSLSAPMTGPGGRWRPLSELPEVKAAEHFADLAAEGRESCIIPSECPMCAERDRRREPEGIPADRLIEGMRRELEASAPAYADARAAEHFAALARVGRESCIGFCPICAERKRGFQ